MRDIIKWLRGNEKAAQEIYAAAADIFTEEANFSRFLKNLAKDEAMHFRVMQDALEFFEENPGKITASFILDLNTRSEIDQHIRHIQKAIGKKTLTKRQMVEYIVLAERSEWNDIFLYVVNTLKEESPDFSTIAPKIQHHLRSIEKHLLSMDEGIEAISKLRVLKPVWDEKILVVDDSSSITELLSAILGKVGTVETAPNGAVALNKTLNQYYAVIISDVNMPLMNGLDFYKTLESFYESAARRFLFISGYVTSELIGFCRQKRIPILKKPFNLAEIYDHVYDIMERNARTGEDAKTTAHES